MPDDRLAAALEEIRERRGFCASHDDVPRLLAAVEAVLALHRKQERPVRSYTLEGQCAEHRGRLLQARPAEARTMLEDCPDCVCTEYYVCRHCHCPNDEWPCPTRRAIGSALLPEEDGNG